MKLKTIVAICILAISGIMASQSDNLASGIIMAKRTIARKSKRKAPSRQRPGAASKGLPSGAVKVDALLSKPISTGVIVARPRSEGPARQKEQPSTAQDGLVPDAVKGSALLKNVGNLAFLMRHALDMEVGTDENILEAIAAAKGASLGFLFNIATPKMLGTLAELDARPMIKKRAQEALDVHEQLLSKCIEYGSNFSDAIAELIGGVTTFGKKCTRHPCLTDGVYADVLVNPDIYGLWFQQLLDEARPVAIELGFNRCGAEYKAGLRYFALKDAYNECIVESLARRMVIAPAKNNDVSFDDGAQLVSSFLKRRYILDEVTAEPSSVDSFDLSSLEPAKVHLKEGSIPEEIIELAMGGGLEPGKPAELGKLSDVQVQQIRPYGPALVTYIYEQKLDIEKFLVRSGLCSDYETFVAFMDAYGPALRSATASEVSKRASRAFDEFHKALGDESLLRALFSVRNFYAALELFCKLESEKAYQPELLRFLATETRFRLDVFSTGFKNKFSGKRSLTIQAMRASNIREAAERNDLEYIEKHFLKVNVSTYGLESILMCGSKITMEAFNLILSVLPGYPRYLDPADMTLEQQDRIKRHLSLTRRLNEACMGADLDTLMTLLADADCTPGMHTRLIIEFYAYEAVVGVLLEGASDLVRRLVLVEWMSMGAPQDEKTIAAINRCRQI